MIRTSRIHTYLVIPIVLLYNIIGHNIIRLNTKYLVLKAVHSVLPILISLITLRVTYA